MTGHYSPSVWEKNNINLAFNADFFLEAKKMEHSQRKECFTAEKWTEKITEIFSLSYFYIETELRTKWLSIVVLVSENLFSALNDLLGFNDGLEPSNG